MPATIGSHAATSSRVKSPSTPGRPARCDSVHRTGRSAFPLAANSGQYRGDGRIGIEPPLLDELVAHTAVAPLVHEKAMTIVSRAHGRAVAESARPPQMSTTG